MKMRFRNRTWFVRLCTAMLLVLSYATALGQSNSSPAASSGAPAERPGDVYQELGEPLRQVRSSLDNWSPTELAALAAGIRRAQQYCLQVKPGNVAGEELYQLARVCAVGQQWGAANDAATAYIAGGEQADRAAAYAISVNALLNMKDTKAAVDVARTMLRSVPYGAAVDRSTTHLIEFLMMSLDDAALPLAEERQPLLLAALAAGSQLPPQAGEKAGTATLYRAGLQLAYLERYANHAEAAQQTQAALDAALATVPAEQIDNEAEIARARLRYGLLGQKLPRIDILPYKAPLAPRARINPNYGTATVLFLFPEWCAQCRGMMASPIAGFLQRNNELNVRTYGLLALDPDEAQTDPFAADHLAKSGLRICSTHRRSRCLPPRSHCSARQNFLLR